MSIYIALHQQLTPTLMRRVRWYLANKNVCSRRLKAVSVKFGLRTGSEVRKTVPGGRPSSGKSPAAVQPLKELFLFLFLRLTAELPLTTFGMSFEKRKSRRFWESETPIKNEPSYSLEHLHGWRVSAVFIWRWRLCSVAEMYSTVYRPSTVLRGGDLGGTGGWSPSNI